MNLRQELEKPFEWDDIEYFPGTVLKGKDKCMILFYVTARAVRARLEDIFPYQWNINHKLITNDASHCSIEATISIQINGMLVSRSNVGDSFNDLKETAASRIKSAYSDAIKRAATHFGVGAYLYEMGSLFVAYDEPTKRIAKGEDKKIEDFYKKHLAEMKKRVDSKSTSTVSTASNKTASNKTASNKTESNKTADISEPLNDELITQENLSQLIRFCHKGGYGLSELMKLGVIPLDKDLTVAHGNAAIAYVRSNPIKIGSN